MQIAGWPTGNVNAGQAPEPSAMMEPGRVRGWPNGTQVGGNAATNLLAQAVGWWDASLYRPGDRFLRNRGTGRELLDLRLGSSSVVATSNDPEFLRVADVGYVWLSGVAGNSLSMTAPATATQFIAYPLDESVATTTGVASGGATFTFSTVGAWRKIELLDVANVVLDTIDCDAIATGATTSFQSVQNQTVTVNRSTTGRKAVAMPSRWNGGRACFLLGTDDYFEVQDTWQQNLLKFDQGDSHTVIAIVRLWETVNRIAGVVTKGTSSGPNRWGLVTNTAAGGRVFWFGTGASGFYEPNAALPTAGSLSPIVGVTDRSNETARAATNGLFGSSASTARTIGALGSTPIPMRIGSWPGEPFLAAEFTAAAVFRRALTDAELALLRIDYTGA